MVTATSPQNCIRRGGSSYNILLMQSIFEYMVGDEELLDVRTRGIRSTRLDVLPEASMNAVLALARIFSFGVLPALIALFAIIRHSRRRKKAKIPFIPSEDSENE